MKPFWLVLLLMLPGAAAQARPAAGQVLELKAPAPALAGNLLGTPTEQALAVYLPPGYAKSPARHYPVIYLLHGIADTHATWLNYIGVAGILDRLIAAGKIRDVIVVMPDGGNVYGGGYYHNSPVSGNWADFITNDLLRFTDTHFRTLARPGGRALVGWSMGGFGAISLAMDRPGLFSVVYAISPCCLAPVEDLGLGNDALRRMLKFKTPADIQAAAEHHDFYPVAAAGFLVAFSPAPEAGPLYFAAPFKLVQGQILPDDAAYDRYVAEFPVNRVPQSRAALTGLRALAFDYGIDDQFAHIPPATREFSNRLAELRIPHRFEVYNGDHRERVAERLEATILPYVTELLDRPE